MVILKQPRHSTAIILIIISGIFLLVRCIANNNKKTENDDHFSEYAGSKACGNCHKDIYEKFIHTEHFHSSQPASEKNILGNFEPGNNEFKFDFSTKVVMEKRDSGIYQVEYVSGQEKK